MIWSNQKKDLNMSHSPLNKTCVCLWRDMKNNFFCLVCPFGEHIYRERSSFSVLFRLITEPFFLWSSCYALTHREYEFEQVMSLYPDSWNVILKSQVMILLPMKIDLSKGIWNFVFSHLLVVLSWFFSCMFEYV